MVHFTLTQKLNELSLVEEGGDSDISPTTLLAWERKKPMWEEYLRSNPDMVFLLKVPRIYALRWDALQFAGRNPGRERVRPPPRVRAPPRVRSPSPLPGAQLQDPPPPPPPVVVPVVPAPVLRVVRVIPVLYFGLFDNETFKRTMLFILMCLVSVIVGMHLSPESFSFELPITSFSFLLQILQFVAMSIHLYADVLPSLHLGLFDNETLNRIMIFIIICFVSVIVGVYTFPKSFSFEAPFTSFFLLLHIFEGVLLSIDVMVLINQQIRYLLKKIYYPRANIQAIQDVELEMCIICFDDMEVGDRITSLQCRHMFHEGCINSWINRQSALHYTPRCPLCQRCI
jgi:hypothetical protein